MRTRVLVGVLVGALFSACGGRAISGSNRATSDNAGTGPDASATDDAGATFDATATVDAGAMAEGGSTADVPGAASCHVAQSFVPACEVTLPRTGACGPAEYQVICGYSLHGEGCAAPLNDDGPLPTLCCPCLAADAGAACVVIDPSSYNRSCTSDSDCKFITSGAICAPRGPLCPTAAINVNDWNRYWQTVSAVPQSPVPSACGESANGPRAVCIQGACSIE
jgi:hypothetical protein